MTIPEFDTFIAIDWSGAARNYEGISIAMCGAGRTAPRLVAPRGRHWRRREAADWIKAQSQNEHRLLIGCDFAFGFPFEPECGYLGGTVPAVQNIFDLWSLIETQSSGDEDFGCSRFVGRTEYERLFWTAGPKPDSWMDRKRFTERACAEATRTRPDTLFKMLHSKQVGKASITGMRVLREVRSDSGGRLAVWPFDAVHTSVIVEIYPTMFRRMATGSIAKIRTRPALNEALERLGSQAIRKSRPPISDHDTDALVSAAGLRFIAALSDVWIHPDLNTARVQREGWIFGIL
jgi:hypothetical protein